MLSQNCLSFKLKMVVLPAVKVRNLKQNKKKLIQKFSFVVPIIAASTGLNVCILSVDTDIAIYALYFIDKISVRIIVQIGVRSRKRLLDIDDIASKLGQKCCAALPATRFHGKLLYKCFPRPWEV